MVSLRYSRSDKALGYYYLIIWCVPKLRKRLLKSKYVVTFRYRILLKYRHINHIFKKSLGPTQYFIRKR